MAVAAAAVMVEAMEEAVAAAVDKIIPVQIGGLIIKQISSIRVLSHPDYKERQENNFCIFQNAYTQKLLLDFNEFNLCECITILIP